MEATALSPSSAFMRHHRGWSSCVLRVWGNVTLERLRKNSVLREEQGQGHRVAWLRRDLERSSGPKPPDTDRITHLGKAEMERLDNKLTRPPPQPGSTRVSAELLGTGMGHVDKAGQTRSSGLETPSMGTKAVLGLKSCAYLLLLEWSF